MSESLQVGELEFAVRRSKRRRTIELRVDHHGDLVVYAAEDVPVSELEGWIGDKLLWIHKKRALKEKHALPARNPEFVSGESYSYLGRTYPLKITKEQKEPLRFDGARFWLRHDARSNGPEHFARWYQRAGSEWLCERVYRLARRTTARFKGVRVQDLGYRWGSCGRNGVLYMNWRLLQLPVSLIDYVIVHELIHLKERNHSPRFWKEFEVAMPDWAERKERLNSEAQLYVILSGGELRR
jgi:predicted metal-dependent hydrolase